MRPLRSRFYDCRSNTAYDTTPTNPKDLSSSMYTYATSRFYTGNAYFRTGEYPQPGDPTNYIDITLPYYLDGASASWDYDKYDGDYGDKNDKLPLHYKIEYDDLTNLASYEMLVDREGTIPLLFKTGEIEITIPEMGKLTGTEKEVFKKIYDYTFAQSSHKDKAYKELWKEWKKSHKDDYSAYHGTTLTGGEDWERRFYFAAYDWGDGNKDNPANGIPDGVNKEWWENLKYGEDRSSLTDDMAPAEVESYWTGEKLALYFLNTKEQGKGGESSAWGAWLSAHDLDEIDEEKTCVQDASQGGTYLDPGTIIDEETYGTQNELMQKALDGGIYIGKSKIETQAYKDWQAELYALYDQENEIWNKMQQEYWPYLEQVWKGEITWDEFWEIYDSIQAKYQSQLDELYAKESDLYNNRPERYDWASPDTEKVIKDCTVQTQFYNAQHPAGYYYDRSWDKYRPSNILVLDVYELKKKVEQDMPDFNGIVYVDLNNYPWADTNYDNNATGIMLVNGESLPESGLSIVTSNNVFIKGNYNLDPEGKVEKNRWPDKAEVIARQTDTLRDDYHHHYSRIDGSEYFLSEDDLEWQPAEIITRRPVYTLSENFPEPSYMPMGWSRSQQYYDERDHTVGQDFVSGDPTYPSDSWMPTPSTTISTKINQWFTYYDGEKALPSQWTKSWVDKHWPSSKIFALDTDLPGTEGYGEPDTYIPGSDLISNLSGHIEGAYDTKYAYTAIHGSDPENPKNITTPSQDNRVYKEHIYNTAIITPYSTTPYVLEYWQTKRTVNGAFVQLPDNSLYKSRIPNSARYGRTRGPDNFLNYECRYGRDADAADIPSVGLAFGGGGGGNPSWREIDSASF